MKIPGNVLAIVGPKGGVGKTTISANLAIALSVLGKKVAAVDLDLGASNLHAFFGIRDAKYSLDDFVHNRVNNLTEILMDTDTDNLKLICGGDAPGITNMPYQKKMKLVRHLLALEYDFVILDLAPGASFNVVDFAMMAHRALLVTTPEVPSLMNVYSFIKSAVFRRLAFFFKTGNCPELLDLLEKAKDFEKHPDLKTMDGFFRKARAIHSEAADSAKKALSGFSPFVVVNRVRSAKDARAGKVIQNLMGEYLDIHSSIIMTIREDAAVGEAIARMKPVITEAPNTPFCQDIEKIAGELANG